MKELSSFQAPLGDCPFKSRARKECRCFLAGIGVWGSGREGKARGGVGGGCSTGIETVSPPPSECEIANGVARPGQPGGQCHIVCSNRRSHVGGTAESSYPFTLLCSSSYLNGDCVAWGKPDRPDPAETGREGVGFPEGGGGRETKKEE